MGAQRSGGPVTVISRRQTPVTFASGAKQIVTLTRQLAYRYMTLRLTAQPTVAGASNTAANTKLGDEWGIIAKVELIANGTTTLFSCAGSDLKNLSRVLLGINPRISTNLADGATANPALDSTVVIPFLNPLSRRPMDTLLYTGEMTDLRLEVTWNTDWTSINSAASAWTVQPSLEVYTREQTLPTDPSGNAILPNFYRRMLKIPVQISGANQAFRYQLNTGPIYRGLLLNELNGATESNTLLTNVKVFSGATQFVDMAGPALYGYGNILPQANFMQFGAAAGGFFQSTGQASSSGNPQSWRWLDFCEDGYMSEALDTSAIGDTFIEFNVSGAANIQVFTQELLRIARDGTGNPTGN